MINKMKQILFNQHENCQSHLSTRTIGKHERNDQCITNDQTDVHSLCSCNNYYKTFLNDEINDK